MASGLPWDGTDAQTPSLHDALEPIAVCAPNDRADSLPGRDHAVVNADGIVVGLLRATRLTEERSKTARDLMEPAPPSYRPHASQEEANDWMSRASAPLVLVTDTDGRLLGMVTAQALHPPAQDHHPAPQDHHPA